MIPLQQLLGKEDKFFDLFEASSNECCQSVKAIRDLIQNPANEASLDAFAYARRKDKAIHTEINEALCTSVVTALDREDILTLGEALYKIPKAAEKIGERVMLAPHFLDGFDFEQQMTLLEQATHTLQSMIRALHKRATPAHIEDLNDQMQQLEGQADKLALVLLKKLYAGDMEGRRVVFLKDLIELFEKIADRCRDAGNVIVQISIKSS